MTTRRADSISRSLCGATFALSIVLCPLAGANEVTALKAESAAAETTGTANAAGAPAERELDQGLAAYKAGRFAVAESWLQAASKLGNARANEILGFMYANGHDLYPGVPRNRRRAITHFLLASQAGSTTSAFMLCIFAADIPRTLDAKHGCAIRLVDSVMARVQTPPPAQ